MDLFIYLPDNHVTDHGHYYLLAQGKKKQGKQEKEARHNKEAGSHVIDHGTYPPAQSKANEKQKEKSKKESYNADHNSRNGSGSPLCSPGLSQLYIGLYIIPGMVLKIGGLAFYIFHHGCLTKDKTIMQARGGLHLCLAVTFLNVIE